MKSFRSFKELVQDEVRIEEILINHDKYHAHTHKIHNYEKLHEHVHLVMEYAQKLVNVHGLDAVLDSMITDLVEADAKVKNVVTVGNFVKKLFVNALIYHDYGKVNENFQIDKMQDEAFFKRNETNKIGSQHSILSAYVFLNIHLNKVIDNKKISGTERNFLAVSTFLFANPILKHHSAFFEHNSDFEEEKIYSLEQYLKLFETKLSEGVKKYLKHTPKLFKLLSSLKDFFPFYALLKLNFSLLTASDSYATTDFVEGVKVQDFGIIDNAFKAELWKNFTHNTNTPYNGDLMQKIADYNQLLFSALQEQSKATLNKLRQKIAAEAITNLRKHIDQKIFYLEAPTGSGKTNMSFACALELLKADERLNKVFYVFPFTTLITQTFASIKEALQIDNDSVIQLHSKGGFHVSGKEGEEDGLYGDKNLNYLNNLFINYPFTLLSHIKFFNILKGNGKADNYILHRMSNAVVIIDELQTYDPKHWDKIIFFLNHYAKHFNIRFILMSATLPKIDQLNTHTKGKVVALVANKHQYFTNPNFKGRVTFDFSLLGETGRETIELTKLADKVYQELEEYAEYNQNSANGLVEFIIKKSASKFYRQLSNDKRFEGYQKFLISGTILEPRRQEIIEAIKTKVYRGKTFKKSIVITTQVIEAGVNIDMDVGFKDRSLVDSDEQLAGRINRNANKKGCKVFIFNYDREFKVYREDKRYKQKLSKSDYESILRDKNFDKLYDRVNKGINKDNQSTIYENLEDYLKHFECFNFRKINEEFRLIESDTTSVFVPLAIKKEYFTHAELSFLDKLIDTNSEEIQGAEVFEIYKKILHSKDGFINKMINKKQIGGIMSKFMFSTFTNSSLTKELLSFCDHEDETFEQFGLIYLHRWDIDKVYSLEDGINDEKIENCLFI